MRSQPGDIDAISGAVAGGPRWLSSPVDPLGEPQG